MSPNALKDASKNLASETEIDAASEVVELLSPPSRDRIPRPKVVPDQRLQTLKSGDRLGLGFHGDRVECALRRGESDQALAEQWHAARFSQHAKDLASGPHTDLERDSIYYVDPVDTE